MRKSILPVVLLCLASMLSFGQGFKIEGTELRDANGNNFIMKGINVPLAWYSSQTNDNIPAIKEVTNSNTLRIVVETGTADVIWQTAVQKCIDNKMIPMVELHDVTGSNDTARLHDMAEWWASKADFLTRPDIARYILINIANEWSDWFLASPNQNPPSSLWRDGYIRCIQTIRKAGIRTTLVVDAPGYGQDNKVNVLLKYGAEVIAADPEKNILFSIHMYCEWAKNGNSSVTTHLPAVKNAGLPVIVGEFGFQHAADGSCDIDEQLIMNTAQLNGIGWLAWSWIGNSGGVEYLDLAETWNGSKLTAWGETVVNGENGSKTAIPASVFESSNNKYPTVTISFPAANAIFPSGGPVEITAAAADEDGTISKVEFYNGNTLLSSDSEAPYSYTWTNAADATYTLVALVYDNENAVGFSAPVKIRVGEAPVVQNILKNGEFDAGTTGWSLNNTEDANATMTIVSDAGLSGDKALKICSTNPGTENWHVQLLQSAPIEEGKKYEISFMAKADESRPLALSIQQTGGSWTVHYTLSLELSTSAEVHTFTFEPTVTDETATLKFLTGLSNTCIYIDKIVFNEVKQVTANVGSHSSENIIKIYPNPFGSSFRVLSDKAISGVSHFRLINLNGEIVSEGTISSLAEEIILPPNVSAGLFMLIITNENEQQVIKVEKK